jgi:signal transduction histidine kinase
MQLAAQRMKVLIQDLLDYSRTNNTERKFANANLNVILEEVKNELAEMIDEKKATIESANLGEAYTNASLFRQVMGNLIMNALKFSKPGTTPHITIKSEMVEGDQLQKQITSVHQEKFSRIETYCHVSVRDNGIGFDPQYKDKMFEVFQRLHTKEIHPGTGIGLAIVKKIIDHHNGVIIASGEIDKGACFDIYIPAVKV